MAKRNKSAKVDGFGPHEKKKIRQAVRQVWHRSYARRLVVDRCTGADGFSYCEGCFSKCPKVSVDHITPVGEVDDGFLKRMFVSSDRLQGLCRECHREKTNQQRGSARKEKKK